MKILLVDNCTPRPYDGSSLSKEGLGGTEASVIRVLSGLERLGHDSAVIMHCADNPAVFGSGLGALTDPDIVVHLRTSITVPAYKEQFPRAGQAVWWHDLFTELNIADLSVLEQHKPLSVFVSRFAMYQAYRVLLALGGKGDYGRSVVIPNPVETYDFRRVWDGRPVFLYASSPHKGLDDTVEMFRAAGIDGGELWVANPGYMDAPKIDGIKYLGSLVHRALIEVVSRVAAVVNFGRHVPETHGITFAEAARLSVPVIAHKQGALVEYMGRGQLVDCSSQEEVTRALREAAVGKLPSGAVEMLTNEAILSRWEKLLEAINASKVG